MRGAGPLAERFDQIEDASLGRHVEPGRRLVQDEHVGVAGQRDRDRDPLLLAAGELVGIAPHDVARVREPDGGEERQRPLLGRRADRASCSRSTSTSCSPTVRTGFSVLVGSWNTIASRRPHSRRSSPAGWASRFVAAEAHLALDPGAAAEGAHDRLGHRALPRARFADEAEDPPRGNVSETPRTACTGPRSVR